MLHAGHPDHGYVFANTSVGTEASALTVTSGSAHSYGAWVQISSGLTYPSECIQVMLRSNNAAATTRNAYVDIGVGPDANNVTVIAEKICGSHAANFASLGFRVYKLPLRIRAGQPIWVRHQNTVATAAINVALVAYGGGGLKERVPSAQKMVALGAGVATTVGTAIVPGDTGAEGAWTQVVASTSENYMALSVGGLFCTDTTMSAVGYLLDVGIGASGAEVSLAESICITAHNANEQASSAASYAYAAVPTGSRLSVRASCNGVSDAGLSVILYGFVA